VGPNTYREVSNQIHAVFKDYYTPLVEPLSRCSNLDVTDSVKGIPPTPTARGFFERALALDLGNLDAVLGKAAADVQAATGYYVDDKAERFVSVEANLNRVLSQSPATSPG
jgi:hypothetical protein